MKETICSLIIDDIQHTKQLQGLERSGFDTTDSILSVSDSVFNLAGVAQSPFVDEITKGYFDLVKRYLKGEPTESVETFANRLYCYLNAFNVDAAITPDLSNS